MEELIYWGIIFLFYLFSAYRSRQKKVEGEQFQVPDPLPQTENKTSKTDFNIFEFLNEAMEKSAVELDDSLNSNFVEPSKDDSLISRETKQSVQTNYAEVEDLITTEVHEALNELANTGLPKNSENNLESVDTDVQATKET